MASITIDAVGPYITFRFPQRRRQHTGPVRRTNPKRFKVRLTGWSDERCHWALHHVNQLTHAAAMSRPVPITTIRWVQHEAPESLRVALSESGLVDDRRTIRPAIDAWLHATAGRVSPARYDDLVHLGDSLAEILGPETELAHITADDLADALEQHQENHAPNTIAKTNRIVRQFFRWAVSERIIDTTPAGDLPVTFAAATGRHFVPADDVLRVIRRCPLPELRAAIAFARFGGLRASEILTLRCCDISPGSFHVRDSKRGQMRTVPLFPEISDTITGDLLTIASDPNAVLLPTLADGGRRGLFAGVRLAVIDAGIKPWPRLMHNMRASRESELLDTFGLKDTLLWIGNTESVALKHYAMTRGDTFTRAAATRTGPEEPKPAD